VANANGKRPLSTIDSNGDTHKMQAPRSGATEASSELPEVKTHAQSGYSWTSPEDEPGWAWNNKRAVEEANRAWESLIMKDLHIFSELDLSIDWIKG